MSLAKEAFSLQVIEAMKEQNVIFASNSDEVHEIFHANNDTDLITNAACLDLMIRKWKRIDEQSPSWSLLEGARVLDIASGSCNNNYVFSRWDPHFSRFCAVNGAEVVAIDIRAQSDLDKLLFTTVQADLIPLVQQGRLAEVAELKGKKFDIIHSGSFVGFNPAPDLEWRLGGRDALRQFEKQLSYLCVQLLAEGGVISLDIRDRHYNRVIQKMVNGKLVNSDDN